MKLIRLLIPLLLGAFLSGCSRNSSPPTEADARAVVEQQIKSSSQGCIKLVEFHKTGERELASVLLVNVSAKIAFLEDCNFPIENSVIVLKTVPGTAPNVKKGQQRTLDLTLQFEKTDRGWKPTEAKDSGSKPAQ